MKTSEHKIRLVFGNDAIITLVLNYFPASGEETDCSHHLSPSPINAYEVAFVFMSYLHAVYLTKNELGLMVLPTGSEIHSLSLCKNCTWVTNLTRMFECI